MFVNETPHSGVFVRTNHMLEGMYSTGFKVLNQIHTPAAIGRGIEYAMHPISKY
jgi:hypothetical protein